MDAEFPKSPPDVVRALIQILKHQQKFKLIEVLENAKPRVDYTGYDNWDGGTNFYQLNLEVPFHIFAKIEPRLKLFEESIQSKLPTLFRSVNGHSITEVAIGPDLDEVALTPKGKTGTKKDIERIWNAGFLKLFISHLSEYKKEVGLLKDELSIYGVSGFVAHRDIKPTLEWQKEIELALDSMDCLVAMITPRFKESAWVDQEIGIALGKGVFVLPIKAGQDPYGFLARQQAMPGDFKGISKMAGDIVEILLKQKTTSHQMAEGLVLGLERSSSFISSIAITKKVELASNFSQDQSRRLVQCTQGNRNVSGAYGVPEKLTIIAAKHGYKIQKINDDDIPF